MVEPSSSSQARDGHPASTSHSREVVLQRPRVGPRAVGVIVLVVLRQVFHLLLPLRLNNQNKKLKASQKQKKIAQKTHHKLNKRVRARIVLNLKYQKVSNLYMVLG